MTTTTLTFAELVAVGTDRLVASDSIDAIYRVYAELSGDPHIMTHQLLMASESFHSLLVEQFPWLNDLDFTELEQFRGNQEYAQAWLADGVLRYGDKFTIEVEPYRAVWAQGHHDPLMDMIKIMGPENAHKIIGVDLERQKTFSVGVAEDDPTIVVVVED